VRQNIQVTCHFIIRNNLCWTSHSFRRSRACAYALMQIRARWA